MSSPKAYYTKYKGFIQFRLIVKKEPLTLLKQVNKSGDSKIVFRKNQKGITALKVMSFCLMLAKSRL